MRVSFARPASSSLHGDRRRADRQPLVPVHRKLSRFRTLLDDGFIGEPRSVATQFRREPLRNSTHLPDTLVSLLDAWATRVSWFINGGNDVIQALDGDRSVDDSGGGGFAVLDDGTFASFDCTVARGNSSMQFGLLGTEGKLSRQYMPRTKYRQVDRGPGTVRGNHPRRWRADVSFGRSSAGVGNGKP